MIKVKGTLKTNTTIKTKIMYFKKYNLRCKLFILQMKLFYDWVEIIKI